MIQPMPIEEGVEFPMTGIVPILAETPGRVRWPGPIAAGTHNREVLREVLSMDDATINELAERGVI
jgi:crotonobetainyl-CoA:carnitine CoA-transferase CaiB-like acyl-CoA transferase